MPTLTTQPQELVSGPLALWIAPIGTAVPLVDTTPTTPWVLFGVNGTNDYDSTGLTVTHNETLATFTPVGTTAPVAVWRTDEQLEVSVTLADTSATAYAVALNNQTVTTVIATTGAPGESDVSLLQGETVGIFALLCRGISALNNVMNAQYAIPAVYQSANPAPVYKKGAPAELTLTFATILDPNGGGFGKLQQQSAARI
ncbi:MAG: hypothetical protein ACYCQK_01635 [Acidiferrobacteraceae bacterium]